MLILVNCSHPLSDAAYIALSEKWGDGDEIEEILVKCQIDFNADLVEQVDAMLDQVLGHKLIRRNLLNVDFFIPPAFSTAATILILRWIGIGGRFTPNIVVMARDGDALPPRFMPVALVGN